MELSALCVGQASVDLVGAIPRYPVRLGDKQELSAFALQGGGAAANSAATLARLGARAMFGGVLPDDFLGDFAAASLSEAGVDLKLLRRQSGGVAPVAFIALDEEKRKRTVFFTRGDCEDLKSGDIPLAALDGLGLLLVDGAFPEAQLELVQAAHERGIKTMLTAHAMGAGMAQLAASCDAVIASEGFARELSPLVPRSLQEILGLGASCAVVTLGEDGCVGQEKGKEPVRVECLQIKVLDPTGAGDVFRGAFGYAWLKGMALRERMRFASTAASLKCQSYGSREGIPDLATVEAAL
jgi:sulfofructose kinase